MNKLLLAAAILSLTITVAHIVGGGAQYHAPILAGPLDVENKAIYSILWHFASLILALNTAALARLALSGANTELARFIALQAVAFAGLFLFYGLTRMGTVLLLPQWTAFLGVAVLAWLGARQVQQ